MLVAYQSQFQGLPSPKKELADNRRAGGRATNARGHGLGNVGRGERHCQEEQEGKHVSSSPTAAAASTTTTTTTTSATASTTAGTQFNRKFWLEFQLEKRLEIPF